MSAFANPFRSFGKLFAPKGYKSTPEVESAVPYVDVYSRYLLDARACTHAFYEIEAPATDVAAAEKLNRIRETLVNLIDNLPEKIFQIQFTYSTSGDYRPLIAQHGAYTSDWKVADGLRHDRATTLLAEAKNRKLIRSSTVMTLGVLPIAGGTLSASQLSLANTGKVNMRDRVIEKDDVVQAIMVIKTAEGLLAESLEKVGIKARPMSAEQIAEYLYQMFNPGLANDWGVPLDYDYDTTPFNAAWIRNDFGVEKDCLRIGDYYHAFVSMNGKPAASMPRDIEKITTGLGFNDVRTTITLRRLDKSIEADNMRAHLRRTILRMKEPLNLIDRIVSPGKQEDILTARYNVEAADEADEATKVISDLRTGKEFLAMMQLTVHTWSKNMEEINRRREIISTSMAEMNKARAWVETAGTFDIFKQSLPASSEPHTRWQKVVGHMAADLIPLHRGFEGGDEPVCIFRNRTGGLVTLNLFQKGVVAAPLAFVSGASGSGKSFLVNQLILQHMVGETIVMIMDIGGSYIPLTKMLGGQIVQFDLVKPFCLNPLQMFSRGGALREPDPADRIRMGRCLESMMLLPSDPGGDVPPEVPKLIDRSIQTAFSEAVVQGREFVTLSDVVRIMKKYPDGGEAVAERLKRFTRGQDYGQWFDGPTTIDLQSKFVCFDMKGVSREKKLCSALAPIIINYIQDIVFTHKQKRKILIMDEMWEFLTQERILKFIVEAWKTFRKENTMVVGISQNLSADVKDNPKVAGAIIPNTETWFLLDQGDEEHARETAGILGLTEGQTDLLRNLRKQNTVTDTGEVVNYRECLMVRASSSVSESSGVIQIRPMAEEYWIFTTEPEEAALMAEVTSRFDGDVMASARYLGARYPGGLHLKRRKDIETGKAKLEGID